VYPQTSKRPRRIDVTIKRIDLNPEKNWTFATCVIAGDFVYTSHTGGIVDDEGNLLKTVEEQTEQSFRNLEKTLAAAGATLADVVKTTVYLKDIADFHKMREVYRQQFSPERGYPARMTATTEFVSPDCLVLMEAVAYKPR
jgi:2-iminobutanoate/2-iminopropanoate deaminase